MRDLGSRRGATNLAIPLMLLAFLLMAGFLWWLSQNAESTEVVVEEQRDTTGTGEAAGATRVSADQLRLEPGTFTGQTVQVTAPVASMVGPQAFFLDLPQTPFLVKLDPALVSQGAEVPSGSVTVIGTLLAMNDSIVRDWVSTGSVPENDQILIEFATHFIEARQLRPAAGGQNPETTP